MLSAYDLSNDPIMLARATELGDWLLPTTSSSPSGFPLAWTEMGWVGGSLADSLAEIGSLQLEFTRLSMLTGDERYYNAVSCLAHVMIQFCIWTCCLRMG